MTFQTNNYQTAVSGNPVSSALASGNALASALQRQQEKESVDFLSQIIARGGNQQNINTALNMAAGNGVSPNVLTNIRGTTPDANKAASYKAGLDNLKLIADTNSVNMNTQMAPINAQSQDLRDAILNKTTLQGVANTRDSVNENRNAKTMNNVSWQEYVESGGNPNAVNPTSGASGKWQFTPETGQWVAEQMGIPKNMWNNPAIQDKMKAWYDDFNTTQLKKAGVPITPLSKFGMHNQGAKGFTEIWNAATKGTPLSQARIDNMKSNLPTINGKKVEYTTPTAWLNAWDQHRKNYEAKQGQAEMPPMTNDALKYALENKQKVLDSQLKANEQKPKNGMVHTMAKNMMENAYAAGDPAAIKKAETQLEQYSLISGENLSAYRRPAKSAGDQASELDAQLKLQSKKDILKDAQKHSPKMYQGAVEYMNRNGDNLDPTVVEQIRDGSFIPDQLNETEREEVRAVIDSANIDTNIFNLLGDKTGQELMRSAFADMARYKDMTGLKDPAGNTQAIKKVFERYGIEFGGDETWDLGKDVELIPGGLMDRVQKNRLSSDIVKARKDKERKEQKGEDTSKEDAQIKKYQIQLAKEFGVTENIINFVNNINN